MASDRDQWADNFSGDNSGGWLTGFLAEEDELDRRALWRLGSWGVGSVAAVVVALLANQSSVGSRREQVASSDLVRQSQQIQWVAKESQNETRRLASAIDTLNSDRDRLYSRVTVLEQGLDTITGSIGRQSAASPVPSAATPSSNPATAAPVASTPSAPQPAESPTVSQNNAPAPTISQGNSSSPAATSATPLAAPPDKPSAVVALQPDPPAASLPVVPPAPMARPQPTNDASRAAIFAPAAAPAVPLMPAKSIMAPPDAAAAKLTEPEAPANTLPALPPPQTIATASTMSEPDTTEIHAPAIPVQRTEFGIDLGGANSIDGLRALWRSLLKYRSNKALAELRPIIVVKERTTGLGMQLRLVAGPLSDAATAARICATLTESDRACETTIFDGQRLVIKSENGPPAPAPAAILNGRPGSTPTRLQRKRVSPKGAQAEEPAAANPDSAKPEPARPSLSSVLGLR